MKLPQDRNNPARDIIRRSADETIGLNAAASPADAGGTQSAQLAAQGKRRRYRKGTLLIQEGDLGDNVFVILSGRVKVFTTDEGGHEFTFNVFGPGDYFGEMSLDGGPRSASVITVEDCECAVLDRNDLRAHLARNPDFAFELITTVIRRAREATRVAKGLALGGVYSRVAAFLDNNAKTVASGERMMEDVLTQAEIASRVGASREMVSRIMRDLEGGGYIGTRLRRLVLLKRLPEKW